MGKGRVLEVSSVNVSSDYTSKYSFFVRVNLSTPVVAVFYMLPFPDVGHTRANMCVCCLRDGGHICLFRNDVMSLDCHRTR